MGLRVGNKSPSQSVHGADIGTGEASQNERKIVTKRNTLKELVAGEIKKATVNSQHSGESQD